MNTVTMTTAERHAACHGTPRPAPRRSYRPINRACLPARMTGDAFPRAVGRMLRRLIGRRTLVD